MAQETAISLLRKKLEETYDKEGKLPLAYTFSLLNKAEQMEKAQRIRDYNVGYLDAKCNHVQDAENYVNEQNYLSSDSAV